MASSSMAQVTLTAADATDKAAGWTLSLQTPKEIAGWQMELELPDGVSLATADLKVGDATFTEFTGVKLPARYGAKYKAVGTKTEKGAFLFFIPVAETYAASDFQITGNEGEACTIKLIAENFDGAAAVKVTNIVASDAEGVSTNLTGEDKDFAVNHPKGDASQDFKVNGGDIQTVINNVVAGTYSEASDINNDSKVNGGDIQSVINIIIK